MELDSPCEQEPDDAMDKWFIVHNSSVPGPLCAPLACIFAVRIARRVSFHIVVFGLCDTRFLKSIFGAIDHVISYLTLLCIIVFGIIIPINWVQGRITMRAGLLRLLDEWRRDVDIHIFPTGH